MKILVTGANSLLGANTITGLLEKGYQVRGMVRRPKSIPVDAPGLEEYLGEITRREEVSAAAKGCDCIIHMAANTSQYSTCYNDYAPVNVTGTDHVLQAAQQHGIDRVILVSSANTLSYGTLERPGTEEGGIRHPFTRSCYARSKLAAEISALHFSGNRTKTVIIVNPSFMLGPYDARPGSGRIILRGYKKKIIFVPPGGKNFIHVKDVANAICNAIHLGRNQGRYLLVNENMSYRAFYQRMNRATQNKALIITIPRALLLTAGTAGSFLSLLGLKISWHYNNMRILCIKNYYGNAKAVKELGLQSTPVRTAIEDAVAWFRRSGMLPN